MRKLKRNKRALSPVVASIILIAVTVAVSIAVAIWLGDISFNNPPSAPPAAPPYTGYFSGQVVDASTLNPIPNATVYLLQSEQMNSIMVTLQTNSTGFYQIENVTLPSYLLTAAQAPGYYFKPPIVQNTVLYANTTEKTYTFSAIQLWKISHKVRLEVILEVFTPGAAISNQDGQVLSHFSNDATIELQTTNRLGLNLALSNHEANTAAGPYYGLNSLITVIANGTSSPFAIVREPIPNTFAPLAGTNMQSSITQAIIFGASGNYTVSIAVSDVQYSDWQSTQIFDYIYFNVNVIL